MKNLLFIILLIMGTQYGVAQNNELTIEEFESIEIGDVLFTDIKNTNGNETLLTHVLGPDITFIDNNDDSNGEGTKKVLVNSSLEFVFTNINSDEFNPELFYLKTNSIEIKSISISINNHYSILGGPLQIRNNTDGTKSIIYTKPSGDCCAFVLETNESGFITKTEYFVWT